VQPIRTPADAAEIAVLLKSLRQLPFEQVVADGDEISDGRARLSDFGLAAPRAFMAVRRADGSADTLYWGDRSPTGAYQYVRRSGGTAVLAVQAWLRQPLDRGVFSLRDRHLVRLEPDSVRSIEIRSGQARVAVSRANGTWRLVRPVEDLGDAEAIERVIGRLNNAQATGIAAERFEGPAEFGLDVPRAVIRVDLGPSLGTREIRIGAHVTPEGRVSHYVRNPEREPVFEVDKGFVADVVKSASDLREKRIFGFLKPGIDRVRLERPGHLVECRRDSAVGGWIVVSPKLHLVKGAKVDYFIHSVWGLKATAFVAEAPDVPENWGLDPPAARISLWRGDELVRAVSLGRRGNRIFARADHRPEVVEIARDDATRLHLELVPVVGEDVKPDTVRLAP
jgi:hypothetical protein